MAQPINCDYAGEVHPADVLVSRLGDGETTAWCDPHYIEVARAIVDAVEAAERQATDEAALAQLGVAADGQPETIHPVMAEAFSDAPAVIVDGAYGTPPVREVGVNVTPPPELAETFPTWGDSSDAGAPPAEPPTAPDSGPPETAPPVGATRTRKPRPEPSLGG